MDQRIISLYDRFTHGGISRREFLDRLTELAGSAAAGVALLPLLQNDYAQAAIVADNDARLATEVVADLRTEHRTMDGSLGVRYEISEYLRVFGGYDYRYQDQRNGQPELAVNFTRHVVTVGIAGEDAIPRRIDDGEDPDAALSENPP